MKTDKNILDKVTKTLDIAENISEVQVSPFFKDKVMQQLFTEKKREPFMFSWFTPQLQLATLVCVVALNIFVLTQLNVEDVDLTTIEEFAQTYDLSTTEDVSLFN